MFCESAGIPPPFFRDGSARGLRGAGALGRRSGRAEGAQRFRSEGAVRVLTDKTRARNSSPKFDVRVCAASLLGGRSLARVLLLIFLFRKAFLVCRFVSCSLLGLTLKCVASSIVGLTPEGPHGVLGPLLFGPK